MVNKILHFRIMSALVNVYALFSGCSEAESPPDTFKDSKLLFG